MLRVNTSSVVQWSCHNEVKACKQLLLSVIIRHYNAHDNFRTSRPTPKLARRVPYRLQAPCASANVWSVGLVELYGTYDNYEISILGRILINEYVTSLRFHVADSLPHCYTLAA